MRDSPKQHFIRCAAAPVLLVLVAAFQVYNVHFHDLSPWKGGGFGMFAVSSYRTFTVDGTTMEGEDVYVDFRAGNMRRLSLMPDPMELRALAERLLESNYIDAREPRDAFLERVTAGDADTAAYLNDLRNEADTLPDDKRVLRRVHPNRNPFDLVGRRALQQVSIQRWRIRLDPEDNMLRLIADGAPIVVQREDLTVAVADDFALPEGNG